MNEPGSAERGALTAPGSEARRAVIATALGLIVGTIAALFAKRDGGRGRREKSVSGGRAWRGRSAT